jgi:hypothetical protein
MKGKTKIKIGKFIKNNWLYIFGFIVGLIVFFIANTSNATTWERQHTLPRAKDRVPGIEEEIVTQANKAGINPRIALNIAFCESKFNTYAKNPNSTAKGIYQFVNKTWENYCEGEVYNARDNIKCFVKWYKIYPSWWECS